MKQIKLTGTAIGLALIFLLCGCSGTSSGTQDEDSNPIHYKYKVGVVLKAMDSEYGLSLKSGIEAASEDFKINSVIVHPESETDVKEQNIMINDMLNSDMDAIVVMPCDSYNTKQYMDKAREKGIPVFAMDTEMYGEGEPYIGSDNKEIGIIAGKYMSELLGGKGTVAILAGTLIQSPHAERLEGFKKYIESETKIKIVYEEEAYCSFQEGVQKTKEIFAQHPDIDGIFCTNATMALGVVDRMEFLDLKKQIPIIGVDTQSDSIQKILDGKIAGMVSQSGYDIAYETIKTVAKYLNGEKVEGNIYIKSELITKKNALKYLNAEQEIKPLR
jgi:ABC-type sugar transport system, periplasmic component